MTLTRSRTIAPAPMAASWPELAPAAPFDRSRVVLPEPIRPRWHLSNTGPSNGTDPGPPPEMEHATPSQPAPGAPTSSDGGCGCG